MTQLNIVSNARKLLLQVGEGPAVSFPTDVTISDYGANNDAPVVVVHNATDTSDDPNGTWQGAGTGDFVIVNEVPEDIANGALDLFEKHHGSIEDLQAAIAFLKANGCADQYTTGRGFWSDKLSPAGRMFGDSGIMKRDDRDMTPVYRSDGKIFVKPNDEARVIETDILQRTYRMADGSPIDLTQIPEINDEHI